MRKEKHVRSTGPYQKTRTTVDPTVQTVLKVHTDGRLEEWLTD